MNRESRWRRLGSLLTVLLTLLMALAALILAARTPEAVQAGLVPTSDASGLIDPLALQPHEPIHITSNDGFNASNGVRGGSGTASDPYLISNWFFDGALYPNSSAMIWLENTDRHVVVQSCQVVHFETVGKQYQAFYVGKYPGENTTPTIGPPEIDLTSNVTFLNNDIDSRYGYGIQIAEGSSNILVKGNRINIHPDNVSGKNWIYGINAARNTYNITIDDNLVDASSQQYLTVGIHLSDYYVSEQRRASGLVARNNTVIGASGGIQVESSRFTLVRDNLVYQDQLVSLAYGWPRAITLRESALNASVINNTMGVEKYGIIIASSTDNWNLYGPLTSADNVTIRDNRILDVDTGISIGNVTGTRIVNTTFANVALQELNLNGEGGSPRDLWLTDLSLPVRIRSPTAAVPVRWSWTHLAPNAKYNISVATGPSMANASFTTDGGGAASVDVMQLFTNSTAVTTYGLVGPFPSNGQGAAPEVHTMLLLILAIAVSVAVVMGIDFVIEALDGPRLRGKQRRS